MRQLGVTVVFPHSNSHAFNDVLLQASQERTFVKVTTASGEERFRVTYGLEGLERYRDLWAKIRHWRGIEHQLEGSNVPFDGCQEMLDCVCEGQKMGQHIWCYGEGQANGSLGSIAPLFPCRFIPISETNHLGWFQYGTLNRERIFVVDKIKLRQRIDYYLEKSNASFCPLLDSSAIDRIVQQLPSRIDPRVDEAWIYKQGWVRGRYQTVGVEKRQFQAARSGEVASTQRSTPATPRAVAAAGSSGGEAGERTMIDGRTVPRVTYSDIGGLDGPIAKLREAVELPLKMPQLFEHLGISPHKGVLLYGPPGTGKTLLAKAVANECDAHFVLVNGPELISKWHGETEANLRQIFDEARRKAPSVILFDEIDALTPDRDTVTHNYEAVLVSQLLALMDGLVERGDVVVVGTTNRPQTVDPALKRPGRLDLQLEVGLPNIEGRMDILSIHSARMPLGDDVSLEELAARTEGYTGAMLSGLCREAGMICLREHLTIGKGNMPSLSEEEINDLRVTAAHFEQALADRIQAEQEVKEQQRRRRRRQASNEE